MLLGERDAPRLRQDLVVELVDLAKQSRPALTQRELLRSHRSFDELPLVFERALAVANVAATAGADVLAAASPRPSLITSSSAPWDTTSPSRARTASIGPTLLRDDPHDARDRREDSGDRALRVYSPKTKKATSAPVKISAAAVRKLNESGRMRRMRPSQALSACARTSARKMLRDMRLPWGCDPAPEEKSKRREQ
jgi:hypothetical protein